MVNAPRRGACCGLAFASCLLGLGGALLTGCQADDLALAPAKGRVSCVGKPVSSGVVTFVPNAARGASGPVGTAHLNHDGSFSIETLGRMGAIVGEHRVRINLYLSDPADTHSVVAFAERYMHEETSDLTARVVAGQQNEFHFELQP